MIQKDIDCIYSYQQNAFDYLEHSNAAMQSTGWILSPAHCRVLSSKAVVKEAQKSNREPLDWAYGGNQQVSAHGLDYLWRQAEGELRCYPVLQNAD